MVFLGPLWSLAIEEQFYLIWPFVIWQLSTQTIVKVCTLGTLLALLLRWSLMLQGSTVLAYVSYMNTFTRMDGLLTGAFCALAIRNWVLLEQVRRLMPFAFGAAIIGLLLVVSKGQNTWNNRDVLVYGHLLLVVGFACLVLSAYLSNGSGTVVDRVLRSRILRSFGKYSYGIYVYQSFVLALTLHFFRDRSWWGHSVLKALLVGFCWIVAPSLLAFLSYHAFEKRFLRLKDSRPGARRHTHSVWE